MCTRSYRPQPVSAGLFPLSAPSRACVCLFLLGPGEMGEEPGFFLYVGVFFFFFFASGCDAATFGSWERTSGHCVDLDRVMAWYGMAIYIVHVSSITDAAHDATICLFFASCGLASRHYLALPPCPLSFYLSLSLSFSCTP